MKNLQVNYLNVAQTASPLTIKLEGAFHSMNAMDFKKDIMQVLTHLKRDCILDLSAVDHFDIAATNTLVRMHIALKKKGLKLVIKSAVQRPVAKLLELTKFDRILEIRA